MGSVYRALDTKTNLDVAVKMLHPQHAGKRAYVERFRVESDLAVRLNHPNVCRGLDRGEHNGVQYLVMEMLTGRSIAELVNEDHCVFNADSALSVLVQAAAGLDAMMAVGGVVAHRDMSSANVFVNSDGLVKIADFGIAKLETGNETGTGSFLGNVNYMSPEQINDPKRVDIRSDLYSLGVVLYEMLAGRRPFAGSPPDIANQHLYADPVIPVLSGQHAQLCTALLTRLLAKQPEERFSSPRELIEFVSVQMPEIRPVLVSPRPKLTGLYVGVAAVALVVGLFMISGSLSGGNAATAGGGSGSTIATGTAAKPKSIPADMRDGSAAAWETAPPAKGAQGALFDVKLKPLDWAQGVVMITTSGSITPASVAMTRGTDGTFVASARIGKPLVATQKVGVAVRITSQDGKVVTSGPLMISVTAPRKTVGEIRSRGAANASVGSWERK